MPISLLTRRAAISAAGPLKSARPKAKKFNYPDSGTADVVEQALSDYAAVLDSSVSDVIVNTLLEALLPKDLMGTRYAAAILADPSRYTISKALADILEQEAVTAARWSIRGSEGNKALVRYLATYLRTHQATLPASFYEDGNLVETGEAEIIIRYLTIFAGSLASSPRPFGGMGAYFDGLLAEMRTNSGFLLFNVVDAILECWEPTGGTPIPYRALATIARSASMRQDTPADRIDFLSLLRNVSSLWDVEEARLEQKYASGIGGFTNIPIANGATAVLPTHWAVANIEEAGTATMVYVIEARNAHPAPPLVAYFASSEENIKARAVEAGKRICPELISIEAKEVPLRYGRDGGILNMDDYASSPRLEVYRIFEKGKYPLGDTPYGACILPGAGRSRKQQ